MRYFFKPNLGFGTYSDCHSASMALIRPLCILELYMFKYLYENIVLLNLQYYTANSIVGKVTRGRIGIKKGLAVHVPNGGLNI